MLSRALASCGRLLGLGKSPAPATGEDRRAFGRIHCNLETTCRPAGQSRQMPFSASVRNVSRSGICLLVGRAVPPGELLSVSLPAPTEDEVSEVLACVVRCDRAGEDGAELGCTFATPLADADLQRFLAGAPQPEQRSRPRFPVHARAIYQVIRTPEPTEAQEATVLNISGGGIALAVAEALTVGELLSIELRRDEIAVLTALASVVRTTVERGSDRVVGCNFIHELPGDQLARLLA